MNKKISSRKVEGIKDTNDAVRIVKKAQLHIVRTKIQRELAIRFFSI